MTAWRSRICYMRTEPGQYFCIQTEGRPPEALRQLARYMEHSTAENVKSEELARLHEMVMNIKSDREVGLAYMKAYEAEKRIRKKEQRERRKEKQKER